MHITAMKNRVTTCGLEPNMYIFI